MIMRTVVIIALVSIFSHTAARTQSAGKGKLTASEVLAKVQDRYAALEDASADFTQTVSFKYAKIEQTFTGTVMMKKGNKYRIESQQQTIVTDGRTVWAYTPVNGQVLIDSYRENTSAFSPERFLVGLPRNFRATYIDDNTSGSGSNVVLKLEPKQDSQKFVKSLKVWVDPGNWSITRVEYFDLNETRTVYSLSGVQFNREIADKQFTFSIPAGVEVVDLRSVQRKSSGE